MLAQPLQKLKLLIMFEQMALVIDDCQFLFDLMKTASNIKQTLFALASFNLKMFAQSLRSQTFLYVCIFVIRHPGIDIFVFIHIQTVIFATQFSYSALNLHEFIILFTIAEHLTPFIWQWIIFDQIFKKSISKDEKPRHELI